jgi:hypothetical protein
MASHRFWVVGGEFLTLEFDQMIYGTERLFGPFDTHADAERAWRDVSEQHRSRCTVRFTIAQEPAARV